MNLDKNIKISSINNSLTRNLLENLYNLNQQNTPEVGTIKNIKSFSKLIEISSISLQIEYKNQLVGFIVCFREKSEYKSLNYKFFSKSMKKFLYIDRVVINSNFRRIGIGTEVYKYLRKVATKDSLRICCEVNSKPRNNISINFHLKNGFNIVGDCDFEDHSVLYFCR